MRPTKLNNKRNRCTRIVAIPGRITTSGSAGRNSLTFNGRIGGKRLGPGRDQLIATPSASGIHGVPRSLTFRLLG